MPLHQLHAFHGGAADLWNGRCLMATKQSRIGWAPQSALPGDYIYILRGCKIPFVFRESSEGAFRLIGDAYMHGQMDYEPELAAHNFAKIRIV